MNARRGTARISMAAVLTVAMAACQSDTRGGEGARTTDEIPAGSDGKAGPAGVSQHRGPVSPELRADRARVVQTRASNNDAVPIDPLISTQQTELLPADGAVTDEFGESVAVSGDTAVIGAPLQDETGAAYVFVRHGTSWAQQAVLLAADGAQGDSFGTSVAISGHTVVIGAPLHGDRGHAPGAAYVFVRHGASWIQQAELLATDGVEGDSFGVSVAVSGHTVVIGAPGRDDLAPGSGAAYVFVRHGASWIQQAKLLASDGAHGDSLGSSVAVSGDAAVIGAPERTDLGRDSGAAYVFVRSGTSWPQQAKLLAADGAISDFFGTSVAASGDTAVIGGPHHGDLLRATGAAYVFVRSGTSWPQQAKLLAGDGARLDNLGTSVAVSGDTAVIGTPFRDDLGSNSGAAYVFVRSATIWTQQAKLLAADGEAEDGFATSVAVSGSTVVVGAPNHENPGASFSFGSAYAFASAPSSDGAACTMGAECQRGLGDGDPGSPRER